MISGVITTITGAVCDDDDFYPSGVERACTNTLPQSRVPHRSASEGGDPIARSHLWLAAPHGIYLA